MGDEPGAVGARGGGAGGGNCCSVAPFEQSHRLADWSLALAAPKQKKRAEGSRGRG